MRRGAMVLTAKVSAADRRSCRLLERLLLDRLSRPCRRCSSGRRWGVRRYCPASAGDRGAVRRAGTMDRRRSGSLRGLKHRSARAGRSGRRRTWSPAASYRWRLESRCTRLAPVIRTGTAWGCSFPGEAVRAEEATANQGSRYNAWLQVQARRAPRTSTAPVGPPPPCASATRAGLPAAAGESARWRAPRYAGTPVRERRGLLPAGADDAGRGGRRRVARLRPHQPRRVGRGRLRDADGREVARSTRLYARPGGPSTRTARRPPTTTACWPSRRRPRVCACSSPLPRCRRRATACAWSVCRATDGPPDRARRPRRARRPGRDRRGPRRALRPPRLPWRARARRLGRVIGLLQLLREARRGRAQAPPRRGSVLGAVKALAEPYEEGSGGSSPRCAPHAQRREQPVRSQPHSTAGCGSFAARRASAWTPRLGPCIRRRGRACSASAWTTGAGRHPGRGASIFVRPRHRVPGREPALRSGGGDRRLRVDGLPAA